MSDTRFCSYCGEKTSEGAIECNHCGKALQSTMTNSLYANTAIMLALGDKYEILEVIGKGGMATVYKANQKNLNRLVALKIVNLNLINDTEFLDRFHREAQMAASLNHPNIVMIYDEGSVNGIHYISMEYLEGEDLLCHIRKKGKLSVGDTIKIISPIAEALDFAHTKGFVHRDVKSANIIVTKAGRPVLTDFGIAHAADGTRLTQIGTIIGTPEYMSPEQAEGKIIDGRSDIFSLGVVLFECLTGNVPFKGNNPFTIIHGIIHDSPTPLKKFNIKVPAWMESILMCSLAKKPEERFSTGLDLSECLLEKKSPSGIFRKRKTRPIVNELNVPKGKKVKNNSGKIIMSFIGIISLFLLIIIAGTIYYRNKEDSYRSGLVNNGGNSNQLISDSTGYKLSIKLVSDAERAVQSGKTEEALLILKEAQSQAPTNLEIAGKITDIEKILSEKKKTEELMMSAQKYFENKDYSKARNLYSQMLEYKDVNEIAVQQIGIIDQILLKDSKDRNDTDFRKFIVRGDSLYAIKQLNEARIWYEKAGKLKPKDAYLNSRLVLINTETAMNDVEFEKLITSAQTNIVSGKFQKARDQYAEALKLKPGNQIIKNKLDSLNSNLSDIIRREINNNLISVQGGTFKMGSDIASDDQKPEHDVTLTSFSIDKYEVTVRQYRLFCESTGIKMPKEPKWGWKDNHPIVNVEWEDASAYAKWAGKRLPSEAEWEYAAMGGNRSKNFKYSGNNNAGSVATYISSTKNQTQPVESNSPNELGIYNMSGNTWEWCNDFYDPGYYKKANPNNPKGPENGTFKVIRGGAWNSSTKEILVKNRAFNNGKYDSNIGFRCVKDQ
jgi:serine/threonine protein kinase/formylglycine-generating enzyme required for sulfatase activity